MPSIAIEEPSSASGKKTFLIKQNHQSVVGYVWKHRWVTFGSIAYCLVEVKQQRCKAMGSNFTHFIVPDLATWILLRSQHVAHSADNYCHAAAERKSTRVLNTYTFIAQKVAIFAEQNSKIASLMACQRPHLLKTLKYSQSWTACLIFEYPIL